MKALTGLREERTASDTGGDLVRFIPGHRHPGTIDKKALQKKPCTVTVKGNPILFKGWKCTIVLDSQQPRVVLSILPPSLNVNGKVRPVSGSASICFTVETCDINMGVEQRGLGQEKVSRLRSQYPVWFEQPDKKRSSIRIRCIEDPVRSGMPCDLQGETRQQHDALSPLICKDAIVWILSWWMPHWSQVHDVQTWFRMLQAKVLAKTTRLLGIS